MNVNIYKINKEMTMRYDEMLYFKSKNCINIEDTTEKRDKQPKDHGTHISDGKNIQEYTYYRYRSLNS